MKIVRRTRTCRGRPEERKRSAKSLTELRSARSIFQTCLRWFGCVRDGASIASTDGPTDTRAHRSNDSHTDEDTHKIGRLSHQYPAHSNPQPPNPRTSSLSLPVLAWMSARTASPFSGFRTAMITSAPHAASRRALSLPTPAEAPVMIMVLPPKSACVGLSSGWTGGINRFGRDQSMSYPTNIRYPHTQRHARTDRVQRQLALCVLGAGTQRGGQRHHAHPKPAQHRRASLAPFLI